MKTKIAIIIFAAIIIIAAVNIFKPKNTKEEASPNQKPEKNPIVIQNKVDNSNVTLKNYRESSEKYKYQIDVSYPAFQNIADKNILDSINTQIDRRIQQEVDKYIAEARRNKIAAIFGYLSGNYTNSVDGNTLSVKMEMERYLSGGPKAETYSFEMNYDLKTGKQIN